SFPATANGSPYRNGRRRRRAPGRRPSPLPAMATTTTDNKRAAGNRRSTPAQETRLRERWRRSFRAALVRPHENPLGDRLIGGQREWTEDTLLLVLRLYHN